MPNIRLPFVNGWFSILHSQFFILHSQFFILHSQFFILHSSFSILHSFRFPSRLAHSPDWIKLA
ncbi:MAG TPA: hypothetical protein PLS70_11810, partial [Acidobacteriota bacterium]|nr:hypothetical protein [Acidobacteriota bacterium]